LRDYENYSPEVRKLVECALDLTKRNLGYAYGSSDPGNGGMDCSGFIYYVLKQNGVDDVPRDSSEQYVWLRKAGKFQAVLSRDPNSFELDALKPGDPAFLVRHLRYRTRSASHAHHDLPRPRKKKQQTHYGWCE
jgi:cell wall-associated NlpC family hydrolase